MCLRPYPVYIKKGAEASKPYKKKRHLTCLCSKKQSRNLRTALLSVIKELKYGPVIISKNKKMRKDTWHHERLKTHKVEHLTGFRTED